MSSKNSLKLIHSLAHKKYRQKERLFLVEGDKNVLELVNSGFQIFRIWATSGFISRHQSVLNECDTLIQVDQEDLDRASLLKNPQNCLAICEIPENKPIPDPLPHNLMIFLDGIQDPGNLGTIMRTCDWFGVKTIFCSPDTADMYNPKVIQASMGSFCRVQLHYTELSKIIPALQRNQVPVFGTYLNGSILYQESLPLQSLIVFGNEGNGIRKENESYINRRLKIPSYSDAPNGPESLNVAVSMAIVCAEHRRQTISTLYSK